MNFVPATSVAAVEDAAAAVAAVLDNLAIRYLPRNLKISRIENAKISGGANHTISIGKF